MNYKLYLKKRGKIIINKIEMDVSRNGYLLKKMWGKCMIEKIVI